MPEQVSNLTPIGLMFTLCMGILLLALPRRLALLPIVLTACWMTWGQQIVLAGLHLTMLRVLAFVAMVRIVVRGEFRGFEWLRLDKRVLLWSVSGITMYVLVWGTSDALINRLGVAYNTVGFYFVFRFLVRSPQDINRIIKMFVAALFPVALCICYEKVTGRNPFYAFGGVPEFTVIREGILRCQGPFRHPILAGTFGATWLPLSVGLWWQGRENRAWAAVAVLSSTLITFLSGSSGPIVTYMMGAVALCFRPWQKHMRAVRWSIVGVILALQLAMKEPVWFIFARINILSGSTGWHRSHLIDETIKHFFEWWLIGTKLENVGKWGVWSSDVTNQYILEGITGGLLTAVLFVAVIVAAFSTMGRVLRTTRKTDRKTHLLMWALASTIFVHVVTYMSVSYFDQNLVNWYLALSMVAASAIMFRRDRSVEQLATVSPEPSSEYASDGQGVGLPLPSLQPHNLNQRELRASSLI